MRKIISILALIAIFYGTYKLYERPLTKPTVRIGVTLPLTGEKADDGIGSQNAINMALKKWGTRNTKFKYLVFYLDDKGISSKGLLNAQNLIRSQKANTVLSQSTEVSEYVSQLAEKTQTIHFSCAEDNKTADGTYNFNFAPIPKKNSESFLKDYTDITGKTVQACTAKMYDMVDFIIMAYEAAPLNIGEETPSAQNVISMLHKIQNHQGMAGNTSIDENGIIRPNN